MTEGLDLRDQVLIEWMKANLKKQPQEAKYQLNDWRETLRDQVFIGLVKGKR